MLIFVYGTLMNQRANNYVMRSYDKNDAIFISTGTTKSQLRLVTAGPRHVPFLLNINYDEIDVDKHYIIGEIWKVSDRMLQRLDEFEGVSSNYYIRKDIEVVNPKNEIEICQVYMLQPTSPTFKELHDELMSKPALSHFPKDTPYRRRPDAYPPYKD